MPAFSHIKEHLAHGWESGPATFILAMEVGDMESGNGELENSIKDS